MRTWPHAPSRAVREAGNWIITGATYQKLHLFQAPEDLGMLHDAILAAAEETGWKLEAWAVFSNHYHLVGTSPNKEDAPAELTAKIHRSTGAELNRRHDDLGRPVWFRSWPSRITFERSYLARIAYVHFNPVRHGLVEDPIHYPWCSARWSLENSTSAFYETITRMKIDDVRVFDDF